MSQKTLLYTLLTVGFIVLAIVGALVQPSHKSSQTSDVTADGGGQAAPAPNPSPLASLMELSGHTPPATAASPPVQAPAPETAMAQATPPATGRAPAVARARPVARPAAAPPATPRRLQPAYPPDEEQRYAAMRTDPAIEPTIVPTFSRALTGSKGAVGAVRFSPDGKTLATGGTDCIVRLWDVATGKLNKTMVAGTRAIFSLAYSPDGKKIAVGELGGGLHVMEIATGRQVFSVQAHDEKVGQVQFIANGAQLVSCGCDGDVTVWNAATGDRIRTIQAFGGCILSMIVNKAGSYAALSSNDMEVVLVKLNDGTITKVPNISANVYSVLWGEDDKKLLAFQENSKLTIYDVATGGTTEQAIGEGPRFRAAITPDRTIAVACHFENIDVISPHDGHVLSLLSGYTRTVWALDISPDGNTVAAATSQNPIDDPQMNFATEADPRVFIWDINKAAMLAPVGSTTTAAVSADGQRVAIGRADGSVIFVDPKSNKTIAELKGHTGAITSLAFQADGVRLASGSADKSIRLWNVSSATQLVRWDTDAPAVSLDFLDANRLVAGVDKNVVVFTDTGSPTILGSGDQPVKALVVSPDKKHMVASHIGGKVFVYDFTGAPPRPLERPKDVELDGLAMLPDNTHFVTYDTHFGLVTWAIDALTINQARSYVSSYRRLFAAGESDQVIGIGPRLEKPVALVNLETGSHLRELKFNGLFVYAQYVPATEDIIAVSLNGEVRVDHSDLSHAISTGINAESFSISADGRLAAGVTNKNSVRIWDAATGALKCEVSGVPAENSRGGTTSFSADGKTVAAGRAKNAYIINVAAGKITSHLSSPGDAFLVIALSPDGKKLAFSARGESNNVGIWDAETGKEIANLPKQVDSPSQIAWSPDGKWLLTRVGRELYNIDSKNHPACLWDAQTGKLLHSFPSFGRSFSDLLFSADGSQIVLLDPMGSVQWYDTTTYELADIRGVGPPGNQKISPSADGKELLVEAGNLSIELLDLRNNKPASALPKPTTVQGNPFQLYFAGDVPMIWWNAGGNNYMQRLAPGEKGGVN